MASKYDELETIAQDTDDDLLLSLVTDYRRQRRALERIVESLGPHMAAHVIAKEGLEGDDDQS